MRILFILIPLFMSLSACKTTEEYDLAISHAAVLNIQTGKIIHQTILMKDGKIANFSEPGQPFKASRILNVHGKLVTPAFIDTHIHPTDIFGDYENAPSKLPADSIEILRKKLSDEYLPYGTTTVLTMGQPDSWLPELLLWQQQPDARYVDFYLCGGALISKEDRTPYIGHTEVASPEMARKKVEAYYRAGIQYIKLYYRLKEPEFSAIIKTADSLKMLAYGHIGDFNPGYLSIDQTLDLRLVNYEHLTTIPNSIITSDEDWEKLNQQFKEHFGELNSESRIIELFFEQFRFIKENKDAEMQELIRKLKNKNATFSTTIHRLYEQIAPTFFTQAKDTTLTENQRLRCLENFGMMMQYLRQMHDDEIAIRLGSDIPKGGKVNLSELILLARYGFPVQDIFKIATYNGAKAMGIDHKTGSIEKGKKADIIIWERSPFDNYENFAAPKTIIKDGRIAE